MSIASPAIYDKLSVDSILASLLAVYQGSPAIFTTDPAPGDAEMPYIVCPGAVASAPVDTKTNLGRQLTIDVRCYAEAGGSAITVDTIAERVRVLLHRQSLAIDGYQWLISDISGPLAADEPNVYGRILTLTLLIREL